MNYRMTLVASAVALAFTLPAHAQQQQGKQQGQQQAQQQQQKGKEQKGIVSVSGKVVGRTDVKTTAGDMHKVVKIQTADGRTVVADLGLQAPMVNQGDRVFVSGRSARIAGKPVIFARYVGNLQEVGRQQQGQQAAAGGSGAGSASAGASKDAGAVWDTPDWNNDRFGLYDEDLSWNVDNGNDFDTFYGDAEAGWADSYDDVGDEGWFDV